MASTTPSLKSSEIARNWYVIDASQAPLGRVASAAAQKLVGKHKSTYTPHMDNGDFVIVINAEKIVVTGKKMADKTYYRHSGYIGSTKETTLAELMEKDPTQAITRAVKGMLPKNKLQSERLARLKVFAGAEHPHDAQKPQKVEEV